MSNSVIDTSDWQAYFTGSTRDIYQRILLEYAYQDSRIYCLDTDQGHFRDQFAKRLPLQYIDLGIAEANMMTIAAALASTGKIPFVNTMASFATTRACEQIKIDIAYNNMPVKIVVTHSGLSGGHLGPTHHALEDIAIMRALPNMTVLVPADAVETAYAVEAAIAIAGPVYIRLGRRPTRLIYQAKYAYKIGQAITLRPGHDITIVASGAYPVLAALEAHEQLAQLDISACVLNMHTLKPLDYEALLKAARETRGIITIEEHSVIGGLGGAVAEFVAEQALAPVRRIGVSDIFCDQVGSQEELVHACGITSAHLVDIACQLVSSQ